MKPPEPNGRDAAVIEAEAMAWLAERDEGFAPGRAAAFEAWRRRDRGKDRGRSCDKGAWCTGSAHC